MHRYGKERTESKRLARIVEVELALAQAKKILRVGSMPVGYPITKSRFPEARPPELGSWSNSMGPFENGEWVVFRIMTRFLPPPLDSFTPYAIVTARIEGDPEGTGPFVAKFVSAHGAVGRVY